MVPYIILGVFILFVVCCFLAFLQGLKIGKKQAAAEYAEELRRKAQSEKEFKKIESEIKQEVFDNAENKKAELSNGNTGRDRFNNINNSLQNNSGD